MTHVCRIWSSRAQALAFAGNSLLSPMSQTGPAGLDATFWEDFPCSDAEKVACATERCAAIAERLLRASGGREGAVEAASVEFTRLFIGPPRPAAAPWETLYRGDGARVGFGEPTFKMRRLLRESGLQLRNENNQYADHIGIELLYASVLCERIADTLTRSEEPDPLEARELMERLGAFLEDHPRAWIGKLEAAVFEAAPEGYVAGLVGLSAALLESCAEDIVTRIAS